MDGPYSTKSNFLLLFLQNYGIEWGDWRWGWLCLWARFLEKSVLFSSCPDKATAEANLNHAVVVIGFDENGNYIIKNSWGTGWGMSGFGVVSKDPDCGISSAAYFYYSNAEGGEVYFIRIRWIWGMIRITIPRPMNGVWLGWCWRWFWYSWRF
jgi:hypothetical protein